MGTSHRVSTPGMDRATTVGPYNGLSVGAVVAIAIASTFVVAFFIACFFLWLARRRTRDENIKQEDTHFPRHHVDWEEIETNSTSASRPRKLQKKREPWEDTNLATQPAQDSSEESASDADELMREVSPVRPTPLPQLPPFKKSLFAGIFSRGGSPARSHRSKTSRASSPEKPEKAAYRQANWINEDEIHGPKIKNHNGLRIAQQPVTRDSWPLYSKMASPTLPVVLSSDLQQQYQQVPAQYQGVGSQYQPFYFPPQQHQVQVSHQHIPHQVQHRYGHSAQPQFQAPQQFNAQGQRYLPVPPRPALMTGNSITQAAMGSNQYYDFQTLVAQSQAMMMNAQPPAQIVAVRQEQQQEVYELSAAPRPQSPKRKASGEVPNNKRKASTDSTLSEILQKTEKRLMENSPTKSRPTLGLHGSSSSGTIKSVPSEKRRSESPVKLQPLTYGGPQQEINNFARQRRDSVASTNSDLSEDDSIFGLPVVPPENELPTKLSSPSRTPTRVDKSPSGSLSTIADEDEAEAQEKLDEMEARYLEQIAAISSRSQGRAMKAKSMPAINDPFVSPSSSPSRIVGGGAMSSPLTARNAQDATIRRVRSLRRSLYLGEASGDASQLPPLPPPPPNRSARVSVNLEEELPNQARLGVLPFDLYDLNTPLRTTPIHTPTIVGPNPENMCVSVKAKKSRNQSISSSPTSEVKNALARETIPALRLSKGGSNKMPPLPVHISHTSAPDGTSSAPTKVVPPPHELRPKGSSPTLGEYTGRMRTLRTPASLKNGPSGKVIGHRRVSSSTTIKATPPSNSTRRFGSIRNRSVSIVSKHSSTLSRSSSVYSQESVPDLPQITVDAASSHGGSPAPVLNTVAALRRMNSVVSTGSGPSEGGSPVARAGSGEWNGGAGAGAGVAGAGVGKRRSVRAHHRKGNGSKGSRNYLGLLELKESPERKREVKRDSTDTLGLYDDDGFLISSPVRGGE